MNTEFFSSSYQQARQRFRDAAKTAGAILTAYPLNYDNELSIDVATIGQSNDKTVVISSGIHGVEGFLGSAIQLAWLQQQAKVKRDARIVLIHAINPIGFANGRRCNENNVDLNRNFHNELSHHSASPDMYKRLDPLLNPKSSARRFDPFPVRFALTALRHGIPKIKTAIVGGQYDFPEGLFFGGNEICESTRIVQDNMEQWIGQEHEVIHLDFHSGLGDFADYRLLLLQPASDPGCEWFRRCFDAAKIEPLADTGGVASYVASGAMGIWLRTHFADRNYRFVTPEFGTYSPLRVLAALRAENQAHHYNTPSQEIFRRVKRELLECFCPRSPRWRETVIESGLKIIVQATRAIHHDS